MMVGVVVVYGILLAEVVVTVCREQVGDIIELVPRTVRRSHDMRMTTCNVRRARVRSAEVHA